MLSGARACGGEASGARAGLEAPPGFSRPRWDAEGLLGAGAAFPPNAKGSGATREQRDLLDRARDKAMRALRGMDAEGEGLQLIHADLHMGNTVRTGAGALVPIDFDDAGCGWLGYDVVASVPLKHPEHAAMLEAYLEGHGGEGLGAALEHLPTFYMARSLLQVAWLDHRAHVPKLRELAAERRATVCRRGHREASAR